MPDKPVDKVQVRAKTDACEMAEFIADCAQDSGVPLLYLEWFKVYLAQWASQLAREAAG